MTTENTQQHRQRATMAWNDIEEPGTYAALDGKTMFRVQEDALVPGRSPVITTVNAENGTSGVSVAKISDDPNITLTKARQLCADSDIHPSF